MEEEGQQDSEISPPHIFTKGVPVQHIDIFKFLIKNMFCCKLLTVEKIIK